MADVQQMYEHLLNITSDEVFHKGQWTYVPIDTSGTSDSLNGADILLRERVEIKCMAMVIRR